MRTAGELNSLAVYVLLYRNNTSKTYWFGASKTKTIKSISKQIGVSSSKLYKAISVLEKRKLIVVSKENFKLVKNVDLFREKGKRVFVPAHIVGYKDILMLLKSIPVLSALKSQALAVKKKEHYNSIEHNPNASLSDYKKLRRFKKAHGESISLNKDLMASNSLLKNALEVGSNATVQKIKKFLSNNLIVRFVTRREIAFRGTFSKKEFEYIKSSGAVDHRCFLHKGKIYRQLPTVAYLLW